MFSKKKRHRLICPSSGEITLLKVHKEKTVNSYGGYSVPATAGTDLFPSSFGEPPSPLDPSYLNTNLRAESLTPVLNTANSPVNRPNGAAPHHLTEFYSYDHDFTSGGGGGGPRGPCFIGDTKIRMADGTTKNIEDIQVGDEVVVVSGSWPEAHPTGSDWTRMETFLWSFSSGWSGSFSDTNISYSTSSVTQVVSESFSSYEQFEMWENDTTKNTWEDGYTNNYRVIKASYGHPFFIRPKYKDGRCGERNDNDDGYLCWKVSRKIGKGDQMYLSGSGFVTIKSKKFIGGISGSGQENWNTMYTFRCEENQAWIVNDIIVRET